MTALRSSLLRSASLGLLSAFALGSFVAGGSAPVRAQLGIINGLLGGGGFGGYGGGYYYHHGSRHHARGAGHSSNSDENADTSSSDSTRALASLAPPSSHEQAGVLKSIIPSDTLVEVGASDDDQLTGNADTNESDRDYTTQVQNIITSIQGEQDKKQSNNEGDVTEHAILDALTDSIVRANLPKFETFLGEEWSAERLRVMILKRVQNQIGEFFEGTNRGSIAMSDLDRMMDKAARDVYAELFEASELLAANRGSTLFVQRLYQIHGDLISKDNVREDTELLLLQASKRGSASIEPLFRRDDQNGYALHYRAQRIIFDCLSYNVDTITDSSSGIASTAEIEKRIDDVVKQQCSKWVANQMLTPGGNGLKPQGPVPLRVIWSADGPKDDPSMYGHASDS
jgi:hypothetical protein